MKLNQYGLSPTSDLFTADNAVAYFKMHSDLRGEQVAHFARFREWLPSFMPSVIKAFQGRYTDEQLDEVFALGYDLENGIDNEPPCDDDDAVADDFANFMVEAVKAKQAERNAFAEILKGLD
jgi:hypothetical protein